MGDEAQAPNIRMIESGIQYPEAAKELEKRLIQRALEKNNYKQSKTTQDLRIHRNTLSRRREEEFPSNFFRL